MRMLVVLELDVSKSMAETMQRTGFSLVPDGTGLQVRVAGTPPISRRKTKVSFVAEPKHSHQDLLSILAVPTDPQSK